MPIKKVPISPIIEIYSLKPRKNKIKGTKQVINQALFFDIPKSCHKIFFKVIPKETKESKILTMPKINPNFKTLLPATFIKPEIASFEVDRPETPKMVIIKNK